MSAERAMRRHQQRHAGPKSPPPTAGAVNLDALKGGNPVEQRRALREVLTQHGFICSCGARFEDQAIIAFGAYSGLLEEPEMQQTPMGPMPTGRVLRRDGATLSMRAFHSKGCPDYMDVLKNGMDRGPGEIPAKVIAVRPAPDTEWLGEVPAAEPDAKPEADEPQGE